MDSYNCELITPSTTSVHSLNLRLGARISVSCFNMVAPDSPPICKYFNLTYPFPFVAHVEINRPKKLNAFTDAYSPALSSSVDVTKLLTISIACGLSSLPSFPISQPRPPHE